MATDRWNRVAELFEKAVCASPPERPDLLQRECGNDDELRQQVERLLENDAQAGEDFLVSESQSSKLEGLGPDEASHAHPGSPPAGARPAPADDRFVGRQIGSYTIKQPIAEGGMGAVYLAEQQSPRREVALKILTAGFWSRSAQRRFGFETEILGRLHHPNIAQVYEAGTHELETGVAVPYFAMEYIAGAQPITAYCDTHQLDLIARLGLFCTVCEAVHYGHQKGVVHRDLKPANILIDEDGHVKVIDFGVARSTDSDVATTTMHTEAGQLIGTLAYMSPEQVGGTGTSPVGAADIDTRSDVYSLGVVLFELLTGRLPYDVSHMTIHAATRVICEQEPARPSEFTKHGGVSSVKGDLETIVLKAIEKERAQRYNSAAALAEDIERYVRGEPIAARPPTRWTRVVRWAGRHPFLVTGAICLIIGVSSLVATQVSLWYWHKQPNSILRYRNGQPLTYADRYATADEVRLLARSGNLLHTWGGGSLSNVFAEWVDRPACFEGGSVVVTGFCRLSTSPYAKSLCVYDVNGDYDTPVWHKEVLSDDVLPRLVKTRGIAGEHFAVQNCLVGDVFPGDKYPGHEIVVTFCTSLSQRVIRIYDLGGSLRYEAWHEGSVALFWMTGARFLVCVGDDHLRFWDESGRPKATGRAPFVVFALRPSAGSTKPDDFVNSDTSLAQLRAGNGPSDLVWYKWLYQEGHMLTRPEDFSIDILRSPVRESSRFAAIVVTANNSKCSLQWTINEFGDEVPGTRIVGEQYKQARLSGQPPLPDPDAFELRDDPPADSWPPRAGLK